MAILQGQSIYLDNQSEFKDGIYATYEDFINNDPSHSFESFKIKWVDTRYFNKQKIKSCKNYQDGKLKKTNMRKIWGFCLGGIPYIQYSVSVPYSLQFGNSAEDLNGASSFSRIRILGNLCHFNIEDYYGKHRNSRFTSNVFSKEDNGKMIRAQRLLKLSTGKVYEYDEYVLSQLIKDDELLADQYSTDKDRNNKMFVYLQKYNDRNPVVNRSIMANNR